MKYKSKTFRHNNSFILYNLDDSFECFIDNFEELQNKYLNYRLSDLVHEYNRYNTDIIVVIINHKKYKLATFC